MTTCTHARTEIETETVFGGPVVREENRRAHGNITRTVHCLDCGAKRKKNINQMHVETGPWVPAVRATFAARPQPAAGAQVYGFAPSGDRIAGTLEDRNVIRTVDGKRFRCSQIAAR